MHIMVSLYDGCNEKSEKKKFYDKKKLPPVGFEPGKSGTRES